MTDFTKYTTIQQIYQDIVDIKIQGATNVAIATFEGLKLYLNSFGAGSTNKADTIKTVSDWGYYLATARPNEPLAKNGVKYIISRLSSHESTNNYIPIVISLCNEYLSIIETSKQQIVKNSQKAFTDLGKPVEGIFTHCHSSTAIKVIVNHASQNPNVQVACTETRPLFQGRKTATQLHGAGIDTTLLADSCAESFIIERGAFPIDIVFIGTDQITSDGCMINKIGSYGIALAAYYDGDPVYVVGSILKTDTLSSKDTFKIEQRDGKEIWEDAPAGLKISNPAFELVDAKFITGYITELGIIKPTEIMSMLYNNYKWLF